MHTLPHSQEYTHGHVKLHMHTYKHTHSHTLSLTHTQVMYTYTCTLARTHFLPLMHTYKHTVHILSHTHDSRLHLIFSGISSMELRELEHPPQL